jgi:hypothetical protein
VTLGASFPDPIGKPARASIEIPANGETDAELTSPVANPR